MNWEAAGAIGEMVGAFAVVITLIYLSIQIRSSQRANKALVRETIATNYINLIRSDLDDPSLAEVFVKLQKDEELTDVEKHRLRKFSILNLRYFENILYQFENGLLDKKEWETYRRTLSYNFLDPNPKPGTIAWTYNLAPNAYSDRFQALIETIRTEIEEAKPTDLPLPFRGEKDPYDWKGNA